MAQTQESYYENEELYGSSQYVTLKDILDGLLLDADGNQDHYLKGIDRSLLTRYAKNGIREVNKQAASEVLEFEITVPDSLTFPIPQEFVDYIGVWLVVRDDVTESYRLEPIDVNENINMAIGYLQDDRGDLLYDSDGQILLADSLNAIAVPYTRYRFTGGYQPTTNAAKFSKWGEVTFNRSRGIMAFSSDLGNREIVIRYVSDGLHATLSDRVIRVHKYVRETIENFIVWKAISRSRNIAANAKADAKRDYYTSLHVSKKALANFDLNQIARTLRVRSMTL